MAGKYSSLEKKLTPPEAFAKICRFCAYQERSHRQVRVKLMSFGLSASETDELMSRLITEGFLNEERFARTFAGGKFRIKKWGKNKISHALEGLDITTRCIEKGLKEIDEIDYRVTLKSILKKKLAGVYDVDLFVARNKAAQYAIGRGYEPELVWSLLKEMEPVRRRK